MKHDFSIICLWLNPHWTILTSYWGNDLPCPHQSGWRGRGLIHCLYRKCWCAVIWLLFVPDAVKALNCLLLTLEVGQCNYSGTFDRAFRFLLPPRPGICVCLTTTCQNGNKKISTFVEMNRNQSTLKFGNRFRFTIKVNRPQGRQIERMRERARQSVCVSVARKKSVIILLKSVITHILFLSVIFFLNHLLRVQLQASYHPQHSCCSI